MRRIKRRLKNAVRQSPMLAYYCILGAAWMIYYTSAVFGDDFYWFNAVVWVACLAMVGAALCTFWMSVQMLAVLDEHAERRRAEEAAEAAKNAPDPEELAQALESIKRDSEPNV